MTKDVDSKSLELMKEWERGRYLHDTQKMACLQVLINQALKDDTYVDNTVTKYKNSKRLMEAVITGGIMNAIKDFEADTGVQVTGIFITTDIINTLGRPPKLLIRDVKCETNL